MNNFWSRATCVALVSFLATYCAQSQDILRKVADIRSLSRERLTQAIPVEIQGVVTFSYGVKGGNFVISDGQQSIYVHLNYALETRILDRTNDNSGMVQPGMILKVNGITGAGDYAPVIYPERIQLLGTGPLPAFVPVSESDLLTGSFDSQSVSIRGIIQRAEALKDKTGQRMLVSLTSGGQITCVCAGCTESEAARLIDATVEIRGVAFTFFNRRGEAIGARIELNNVKEITVLEKGPVNPFAAPQVTMDELWTFSPNPRPMHRRRVSGIITFSQTASFFYLQQQDRAIRVTTQQTNELTPGDMVEVAGFVEVPQYYAEIDDAVFRKIGRAPIPSPVPIDPEKALSFSQPRLGFDNLDLDGRLVQMSGKVERIAPQAIGGPIMWLTQAGHTITAELGPDITQQDMAKWKPESRVNVIGICVMSLKTAWPALNYPRPSSFRILVRSPRDVRIVHPAPWWTTPRLLGALITTVAVLALALCWVGVLRRAVVQQTQRLGAEIRARRDAEVEFKATTRERNRLAADLHDTLEQDLTATALQLEASRALRKSSPEAATQHTELAYELLDRSRDDLRRSVWALRTGILEGRTFGEALSELANRTERLYNIPCKCSIQDDGSRVPEFEANHLLLFVQEALANALKHAVPHHINIAIVNKHELITIAISDDGSGFDVLNAPGPKLGHFGLLGMKERLNALGGTLVIDSVPGQGTRLQAIVPLNSV